MNVAADAERQDCGLFFIEFYEAAEFVYPPTLCGALRKVRSVKKKKKMTRLVFLLFPGCSEPLGMKSGHIQDYQVTASSIFRTVNMDMFTWEPGKARLDKQGKVNAWTAGHSDQSQWLQV